MSNIRSTADIEANIDAINAAAEASGTPVSGTELNLLTLEAKAAAAIEKFQKARREFDAQSRVRGLNKGDAVTFIHGRAATTRIESGTILAVGEGATGLTFNVLTGEGIESKTVLIGADAVLLDADDVAAAEQRVKDAKAEAEKKAAANKKDEKKEGEGK